MEVINVSFPNDGLGDKVRNAFIKVNLNFSELDSGKVDKIVGKDLSTNDYTNIDKALVSSSIQPTEFSASLSLKEDKINKGIPNGYAGLDSAGLIPTNQIPPEVIERLVIVTDQAARFALTTTIVQNGDTVKQNDTQIMYLIKDDTNLSNNNGYEVYRAGTAASVPWTGVTSTPTTLAGYNITDATPASRSLNINGVSQDLSSDREWRTALADTGILTFAGLTTNTGTTINIGATTGVVADNETNALTPTYTFINYGGVTNITVTTLGSGQESFVMLGVGGISFQNTFPTSSERKTKIFLGKVSHPAGTITLVVNEPDLILSPLSLVRSLYQKFSYINEGVYPYANGANLNINITGGSIGGNGLNFVIDNTNPHDLTVNPSVSGSFIYRTQTGAGGAAVTAIDPTMYDVAGTPTSIGGSVNNSTIQYFYLVPGAGYVVQYGQTVYPTLSAAISAVGKEPLVIYPNLIKNSILIGVLAVKRNATQLNDLSQAEFFKADIFGQIIGATAGTTVGTMQTGYGNSLQPQIITTVALGAIVYQNGRALDTETIQEWRNIAGTTKASINGNGDISGSLFIKSGGLATEYLKADGSVSTLVNIISGSGVNNYISKWNGTNTQTNSIIYDDGSNVGIGTNSPGTTSANTSLGFVNGSNIQARTAVPQFVFSSNIDGEWYSPTYKTTGYAAQIAIDPANMGGGANGISFNIAPSGTAGNPITWQRVMTIIDGGLVGIGINTPSEKLHVVGNILASGTITPSDRRLKSNINSLYDSLDKVLRLRPVSYNKAWEIGGEVQNSEFGFIAQELKEIFPNEEVVKTPKNEDDILSVNYTSLIAVLTKAIQEQQEQIEYLKSQMKKIFIIN